MDALYKNGQRVLTEINYYYEGWAVADCPGHWELRGEDVDDGKLEWAEGKVRPDDEIFEDFVALLGERAAGGSRPSFAAMQI